VGIAVMATLIWAGCGSGEDSITKAEFTRRANAVCSKWQRARDERFQAAQSKFGKLTKDASKEKAILYILSPYEEAIEELGEIPPPTGEEEKVERFVKSMEEGLTQTKADPLSAAEKSPFEKPNKLAESYGLEECKV
jgi:hypothetical protein